MFTRQVHALREELVILKALPARPPHGATLNPCPAARALRVRMLLLWLWCSIPLGGVSAHVILSARHGRLHPNLAPQLAPRMGQGVNRDVGVVMLERPEELVQRRAMQGGHLERPA